MRMRKKILLILILLGCICQVGWAADLFYTGSIGIDSIRADVDLQDTGSVTLVFTLSNQGSAPETVTVEYWNTSTPLYARSALVRNPVLFQAGEQQSFTVRYMEAIREQEPKTFALDPTLLFNGAFSPRTAGEYTVTLVLPAGVKTLLTSNKAYQSQSTTGEGRVQYTWRFEDEFPTILTVKWTSLGIDMVITKGVSPQIITEQNRALWVEITVQNRGERSVDNLTISDNFAPSDYEALEPTPEFFSPDLNISDSRVIWRKNLGVLNPGEMERATYSVKYIGNLSLYHVIYLPPTSAYQNGVLVGISNGVSVTPNPTITAGERQLSPTVTPLTGWIVVIALIVTGLLAFWRRRED
jgi:hypothetical protein